MRNFFIENILSNQFNQQVCTQYLRPPCPLMEQGFEDNAGDAEILQNQAMDFRPWECAESQGVLSSVHDQLHAPDRKREYHIYGTIKEPNRWISPQNQFDGLPRKLDWRKILEIIPRKFAGLATIDYFCSVKTTTP